MIQQQHQAAMNERHQITLATYPRHLGESRTLIREESML
jgi:hypothetical protein